MASFSLSNSRPFRLVLDENGCHSFGGPAQHSGVVPSGTNVAIQQVISLDLTDPLIPIKSDALASKLPLYYPFKYGFGGPDIQYEVRSDLEIDILHLSDPEPDDKESLYLQVEELPSARLRLEPLTYEQARILGFRRTNGYFQPNDEDREILSQLDVKHLIELGGRHDYIVNAPDVICRNPKCQSYERRVYFDVIAMVPPIPVNNDDEFWYEFQGGDVTFCFGLCHYCGTIIAFNVAT
ncbi:hypothetical protein [Aeoliella sp. SH292]|uniref:hypothetical protein n=1 Tax=Aeoliella sp. SH292 TaxID=3454464 RepID=UPI003F9A42FF